MTTTNSLKETPAEPRHVKWRMAGTNIPDQLAEWEDAEKAEHVLPLDGYSRLTSKSQFERIREALLEEPNIRKMHVKIGDVLGCPPEAVCLVSAVGNMTRKERSVGNGIAFRFLYNPPAFAILKDVGGAIFSKTMQRWTLPIKSDEQDLLNGLIRYFHVIVDLGSMAIMVSEKPPERAKLPAEHYQFSLSSRPEPVRASQIAVALMRERPEDYPLMDKLFIHDGKRFVSFPEHDTAWTMASNVLLRYPVPTGKPRYALYSVKDQEVLQIAFANDSSLTGALVGRYMETFEHYQSTEELAGPDIFHIKRS